ncbi:hypothetical protein T265_11618 [Opisthorchis viverrini]|uniref:Uncharacterized protein n=1 Tax=Opisthorchis viverrini TaxID=6198 RepID=A0A074ZWZ8_OPIVI|nr:hypothetical protein T265_11618 [Opisthorchis viverrini]KER19669.1 hypothetical protein T265_11618 [Opisthorchis viverrini]
MLAEKLEALFSCFIHTGNHQQCASHESPTGPEQAAHIYVLSKCELNHTADQPLVAERLKLLAGMSRVRDSPEFRTYSNAKPQEEVIGLNLTNIVITDINITSKFVNFVCKENMQYPNKQEPQTPKYAEGFLSIRGFVQTIVLRRFLVKCCTCPGSYSVHSGYQTTLLIARNGFPIEKAIKIWIRKAARSPLRKVPAFVKFHINIAIPDYKYLTDRNYSTKTFRKTSFRVGVQYNGFIIWKQTDTQGQRVNLEFDVLCDQGARVNREMKCLGYSDHSSAQPNNQIQTAR